MRTTRAILMALRILICVALLTICACNDEESPTSSQGDHTHTTGTPTTISVMSKSLTRSISNITVPEHFCENKDSIFVTDNFSDSITAENCEFQGTGIDGITVVTLHTMAWQTYSIQINQQTNELLAFNCEVGANAANHLEGAPTSGQGGDCAGRSYFQIKFDLSSGSKKVAYRPSVDLNGDSTECYYTMVKHDTRGNFIENSFSREFLQTQTYRPLIPISVIIGEGIYTFKAFCKAKNRRVGNTGSTLGITAGMSFTLSFEDP